MWKLWIVFSSALLQLTSGNLVGDHVCSVEKSYTVNITEHYVINATVRNYKWCMNVPPRCSYYTTKKINDSRIVEKEFTNIIEECCPGFFERNSKCLPNCETCKNENCDGSKCLCSPDFERMNCVSISECPPGRWGPNCTEECNCDQQMCNPVNGSCIGETGNAILKINESDNASRRPNMKYVESTNSDIITHSSYETSTDTGENTITDNQKIISKYKSSLEPPNGENDRNTTSKFNIMVNNSYSTEEIPTISPFTKPQNQSIINFYMSTSRPNFLTTKIKSNSENSTKSTNFLVNENKELLIPVKIKYDAKPFTKKDVKSSNFLEESNYLLVENSASNGRALIPKDSNLVNSIGISAATTTVIILLAVVLLYVHKIRRNKRKRKEQADIKNNVGISSVSVHTTSIFHTPLPDPPTFENPVYLSPTECQNGSNELQAFGKQRSSNTDQNQMKTSYIDYMYDHPPSTGSYRAASIIEPLDADNNTTPESPPTEPLYDEIPCRDGYAVENTSYYNHPKSLYMNTCEKIKI